MGVEARNAIREIQSAGDVRAKEKMRENPKIQKILTKLSDFEKIHPNFYPCDRFEKIMDSVIELPEALESVAEFSGALIPYTKGPSMIIVPRILDNTEKTMTDLTPYEKIRGFPSTHRLKRIAVALKSYYNHKKEKNEEIDPRDLEVLIHGVSGESLEGREYLIEHIPNSAFETPSQEWKRRERLSGPYKKARRNKRD